MSLIRPNIQKLTPYSPGKPISAVRRELGLKRIIKLASNENPLGPSPKAIAAAKAAAEEMHLYPDGAGVELKQALSAHFRVAESQIVLGNGSDELIQMVGRIALDSPQDEVVMGDPSFVRYEAAAHIAPATLKKVPLESDYVHDLAAMACVVTEHTKLVYIANPNNPTGTIVVKSDLDRFIADLPESTIVVLDEAYFEFGAENPEFPDSLDYIREGKPVVGLRTFSKSYGLAGLRVGYAFATQEIAAGLEKIREPFNVNSIAQAAAAAALEDQEHIRRTLDNNRRGMKRIASALEKHGAKVYPSYANFVFADFGRPTDSIFQALLQQGIIIRPGSGLGTPNCLRITIGTEEEVDAFLEAFEAVSQAELSLKS